MKKIILLALITSATMIAMSCSSGDVRLDVTPSVVIHYFDRPDVDIQTVDAGVYFDMEYTWKVGPNFTPPSNGKLRAFVHFRDSTGKLIVDDSGNTVQDDHNFEIPVSDWKAGEDVVYTRERFRFDEDLGSRNFVVNLYIGIYNPDTSSRAELTTNNDDTPREERDYHVATFRIRKNPKIYPRFNDTWHGPEPAPNEGHRWSKRESVVTYLRDPQVPGVELWISGHSPVEDIEATEQRLWIYIHEKRPEFLIGGEPIVFTGERLELTQIPIPAELYETYTDRDIRIILEVDEVLLPDAADERNELGFRIHELLLQPRNQER